MSGAKARLYGNGSLTTVDEVLMVMRIIFSFLMLIGLRCASVCYCLLLYSSTAAALDEIIERAHAPQY